MNLNKKELFEVTSVDDLNVCELKDTVFLIGTVTSIGYLSDDGFCSFSVEHMCGCSVRVAGALDFMIECGLQYEIYGTVDDYRGYRCIKLTRVRLHPLSLNTVGCQWRVANYLPSDKHKIFMNHYEHVLRNATHKAQSLGSLDDSSEVIPQFVKELQEVLVNDEVRAIANIIIDFVLYPEYMLELKRLGLNFRQANYALEAEGGKIAGIKDNPYKLMSILPSISYQMCDFIAATQGSITVDADVRLAACFDVIMKKIEGNGDCWASESELRKYFSVAASLNINYAQAKKLKMTNSGSLEIFTKKYILTTEMLNALTAGKKICLYKAPLDYFERAMQEALSSRVLVKENDRIYRATTYDFEVETAKAIEALNSNVKPFDGLQRAKSHLETLQLEDKQRQAIEKIVTNRGGVHILSGQAGTGKTFTVKALISTLLESGVREHEICLMAPTGRAAKVLQEKTGYKAKTIHLALGCNGDTGVWAYNDTRKMNGQFIIIDESSMLSIELAYRVFTAVRQSATVILIGDSRQLQPVGAGCVFWDLLKCPSISNTELDVIKRQVDGSGIIKVANCIVNKEQVPLKTESGDAYHIIKANDEVVSDCAVCVLKRISEIRDKELSDTIVISPVRDGLTGVDNLNHLIQAQFNHSKDSEFVAGFYSDKNGVRKPMFFRLGDTVINIKNNHSAVWLNESGQAISKGANKECMGVYNGEIGRVIKFNSNGRYQSILVKYDDRCISYKLSSDLLLYLNLGYAITTHKSQGSQFKHVVGVVGNISNMMNCNNNLYTMVTRASDTLSLISTNGRIYQGINNSFVQDRKTTLTQRISSTV